MRWTLLLLFAICCPVFSQTDANSITVSVSRANPQPPDLALVSVTVTTDSNGGVNRALELVAPYGITVANLSSASVTPPNFIATSGDGGWSVVFNVPLTSDRASALAAKVAAAQHSGVSASITQFSYSQAWTSCPFAAMLQDASARATRIAAASSLNLGAVLALASSADATCTLTVRYAVSRY